MKLVFKRRRTTSPAENVNMAEGAALCAVWGELCRVGDRVGALHNVRRSAPYIARIPN
jgi:hypothetical protein